MNFISTSVRQWEKMDVSAKAVFHWILSQSYSIGARFEAFLHLFFFSSLNEVNKLALESHKDFIKYPSNESHSVMFDSLWLHGLYSPWNSLGQNTGLGSLSLLQGIFILGHKLRTRNPCPNLVDLQRIGISLHLYLLLSIWGTEIVPHSLYSAGWLAWGKSFVNMYWTNTFSNLVWIFSTFSIIVMDNTTFSHMTKDHY